MNFKWLLQKFPQAKVLPAPYESCPTSTSSSTSTSNSTSTPSALQLSLQPRVWHTVLWHIGCQQIGAQFLLSYVSSEGCRKGGGRLACQAAAATAARTARTTASLTRPEIRLSIINNLISPNWRELATRQCHSRRRSQSKGRELASWQASKSFYD